MKSRKWYRRRHKSEWIRQQMLAEHPWMADMERRNVEFAKLDVAWADAWSPLVKAFGDAAKKVCDDYAEIVRSGNKTG